MRGEMGEMMRGEERRGQRRERESDGQVTWNIIESRMRMPSWLARTGSVIVIARVRGSSQCASFIDAQKVRIAVGTAPVVCGLSGWSSLGSHSCATIHCTYGVIAYPLRWLVGHGCALDVHWACFGRACNRIAGV